MRVIRNWEEPGLIQRPLQSGSDLARSGQFTPGQLCQVQAHFLDPLLLESLDLHHNNDTHKHKETHCRDHHPLRHTTPPCTTLNAIFSYIGPHFKAITIEQNGTTENNNNQAIHCCPAIPFQVYTKEVPYYFRNNNKNRKSAVDKLFWLLQMLASRFGIVERLPARRPLL